MRWGRTAALLMVLFGLPAGTAEAGTYEVHSCSAPGANGVNRAWQLYPGFDDRFWDANGSCPVTARSEPRPGVTAPYFTGAGFHVKAPAGAVLDRLVIWRTGHRFDSMDPGTEGWAVGGYNGDGTVIGGELFGEKCHIPPPSEGRYHCDLANGGARVERDIETNELLYSVSCFHGPGCGTANSDGFPFAQVSISGSIVTVRDDRPPDVVARGPLTEPGWHVDDPPLSFGASDSTGIRQVRVLVGGAQVHEVSPGCDFTRMAPCNQVGERAVRLGVPDGMHTLTVEATDTAQNVARADRTVAVDRNPPALEFVPSSGRRRVVVAAPDAGSGTTGGTIEVLRRGSYRALPTRLANGRLVARLRRGSRRGRTFRAIAVDAVGHRAVVVGAPVRLRAGFGPRLRSSARGGLERSRVVRGRLTSRGRGVRGREITVMAKIRAEGTVEVPAARAVTGRRGRFRVPIGPGVSRVLRVISPGVGGLQGARRTLNLRVPWSSTLKIRPRSLSPGGRIRLSGRLLLRGVQLPRSGKRVELQAFDAGRWRVFATTRAFGPRGAWRASYRFGARAGTYRIRVRIPYEGTVAFDRGYSRPVTVRVG